MIKKHAKTKNKPLRKVELISIALGGMVGGEIFSIFRISVSITDMFTISIYLILTMLAKIYFQKLITQSSI